MDWGALWRWSGASLAPVLGLGLLSILLSLIFSALALRGRRVPTGLWLAAPWLTFLVALALSWLEINQGLQEVGAVAQEAQIFRLHWLSRAPLLVAALLVAVAAAISCLASGLVALRAARPQAGWTWWPTVLTGGLTLLGAFALGLGVVFGQVGGWALPATLVAVGLGVALSGGRSVQGPEGALISSHRMRAWLMAVVAICAVAVALPWLTWLEAVDLWASSLPEERPGLVARAWQEASHLKQLGGAAAAWAVVSLGLPSLWSAGRLGAQRNLWGAALVNSMLLVLVGAYAFVLAHSFVLVDLAEPHARVGAALEALVQGPPRPLRPGAQAAPLSTAWPDCLLRRQPGQDWILDQEHSAAGCPLGSTPLTWPLSPSIRPGLVVEADSPALDLAQRPWFEASGELVVMVRARQGLGPEAPWMLRAVALGGVPLQWRAAGAEPEEELGFLVEGPGGQPWWVTRRGAQALGSEPGEIARGLNLALRDSSQHHGALHQGAVVLVADATWTVQDLVTLCLGGLRAAGGTAQRCLLSQQSASAWLRRHKVALQSPAEGAGEQKKEP